MAKNIALDIAQISTKLYSNVNFTSIEFSQILPCELGESVNHLLFVKKMYGLYFYTSSSALDEMMKLNHQSSVLPVYVVSEDSKNVYQIK